MSNFQTSFDIHVEESILRLLDYCKKNDWAGYDPFDGLNSRIFKAIPFSDRKYPRLFFTQLIKRLPFNLRPILLVPREQNPKGIALFISAFANLSKQGLINDDEMILNLINRLIELRSPDLPHYCWGYNFSWQNRYILLPKFHPNIIGTTFAGNALLDAYERYKDPNYLEMANSAGQFLLSGLNRAESSYELCFSYTPYDHNKVHNANMLGAAYLARIYSYNNDREFLDYAEKAMRYSINKQNEDGSWFYGEQKTQKWIDNFHTGYNLIALQKFGQYTGIDEFKENIHRGFKFYQNNFFTDSGFAKYYHDKLYPIDIHSIAQSIITLVEFKHLNESLMDLATHICEWAINNMQNKKGYFYYQKKRFYTNRISYMRWSQAWMLYALSFLLAQTTDTYRNEKFALEIKNAQQK